MKLSSGRKEGEIYPRHKNSVSRGTNTWETGLGQGQGQELNVLVLPKTCGRGWEGAMGSIENEIAEENQKDNKDVHKTTF